MRCFFLASSLKMNSRKCSLMGVGLNGLEIQSYANILQRKGGSIPFPYLGLQVAANMNIASNCSSVTKTFEACLSTWKSKHLSTGGRLVMIKSVMDSLLVYFFSFYKALDKVINALEKIRRNFF